MFVYQILLWSALLPLVSTSNWEEFKSICNEQSYHVLLVDRQSCFLPTDTKQNWTNSAIACRTAGPVGLGQGRLAILPSFGLLEKLGHVFTNKDPYWIALVQVDPSNKTEPDGNWMWQSTLTNEMWGPVPTRAQVFCHAKGELKGEHFANVRLRKEPSKSFNDERPFEEQFAICEYVHTPKRNEKQSSGLEYRRKAKKFMGNKLVQQTQPIPMKLASSCADLCFTNVGCASFVYSRTNQLCILQSVKIGDPFYDLKDALHEESDEYDWYERKE